MEIHAKYDPVLRIKSYAKTPEIHAEYDPVLRIKSYAKTQDIHSKFWLCTKNQKLCKKQPKKHQKFTQF